VQPIFVLGCHEREHAGGHEAGAPMPDEVASVLEIREASEREAGLRLVRVVYAHEGAGFSCRARSHVAALAQHNPLEPLREMKRHVRVGSRTSS